MSALGASSLRPLDLPVCFPGHPCVDFPPLVADAINLTSGLTPVSAAIAAGCFAVLGLAVVLLAVGLGPQVRRPHLWVVALSTVLVLTGAVVETAADLRLRAIAAIFGLEGPGSPDLFGSWALVGLAGRAMTLVGIVALAVTATIAVVWLRAVLTASEVGEP